MVSAVDFVPTLLDVIGADKRDGLISDEIPLILGDAEFRVVDAIFLMATGNIDPAEAYVLEKAKELDGGDYGYLPDLAERFAQNEELTSVFRSWFRV